MRVCTLNYNHLIIQIEDGELISLQQDGVEYIHQKGSKGWRKSDDEMFPVIGPTTKNNFTVHTLKGDAIQDQHGLLRELTYELISSDLTSATYQKSYLKNTKVKNSKFPDKSTQEFLHWPFNFEFIKCFELSDKGLQITFTILSEKGMPFMLGYHPAFLLSDTGKEVIKAGKEIFTLADVYKAGSNAFPILQTKELELQNFGRKNVKISTNGFDNFMLWTEVDNMLCIEPITHYTSYSNQKYSEEHMMLSSGKEVFSVLISIVN